MTIQPVAPSHLLTVAEYLQIGEIELSATASWWKGDC